MHVNGGVKNGVIKNLSGHTEDDLIALNAYDWDNSSINFGAIENLTVEGVNCGDGGTRTNRFGFNRAYIRIKTAKKRTAALQILR